MAAKKPTTASRLSALQATLDSIDDSALDNDPLVADQRARIAQQIEQEERARVANAFSGTTATVDTTATPSSERGWAGRMLEDVSTFAGGTVDALQGGLQTSASNALFTQADKAPDNALTERLSVVGGLAETFRRAAQGDIQTGLVNERLRNPVTGVMEDSNRLSKAAEQNRASTEAARRVVANRGVVANELGEAVLDAAESPTGALSIIGGPLAGVGLADSYAAEYTKARRAGLSQEDASRSAELQAAPEAIGFIPAARLLKGAPIIGRIGRAAEDKLNTVLSRTVAQATNTALGEGLGEAATTVAQLALNKANAELSDSEELRKYAANEVPKTMGEVGEQTWRAFKAGALIGGVAGGVEGRFSAAADAGKVASNFNIAIDEAITQSQNAQVNSARATAARQATPAPAQPTQTEMFPTAQSDGRTFEEQEAARQAGLEQQALDWQNRQRVFDEAETARAREEDAQREEGFRQIELDRVAQENLGSPLAQQLARVGRQIPSRTDTVADLPDSTTAPASVPVDPVQGELNVTTPQANEVARTEIENVIKKDAAKELNAAKAKRAADRRKYREQQLKENTGADRVDVVAQRMVDWDRSNPVPTAQSLAPQTQATPVAATQTPTQTAVDYDAIDNAAETYSVDEQVAAMREFYPTESEAQLRQRLAKENATPTPVASMFSVSPDFEASTMQDVRRAIGDSIGSNRGSNVAAMMIGNNRVRLIDSDAQRPAGADPRGAAYYDGDGITIDVRRVNKNNVRGDLLLLMAHESKHAADFSGAGRTGIESFIGKEANDRIISSIERAAANGDATSQRAVEAARDATNGDAELYAIELPAYFMNATRGGANNGVVGAISRQIVSPIRVAAKRQLGIDTVNLNDVHYLSDRLLDNMAVSNESMAGNLNQPMPMIYNESSAGFNQAEAEGRTYTSLDGNRKYVLSDADSSMKPNGYQRLREATDPIPLGDLMDHPVLYREHPDAADIPVVAVDSLPNGAFAQWHGDTGEVWIAKDKMRTVSPRVSLMHELQHFVQQKGGQQDNFFNDSNDPSGYAQTREGYQKALADNDRTSRLMLDRASQMRSAVDDTAAFDNVLYDFNKPDWQKAAQLTQMVDPSRIDEATASTIARYEDSRTAANSLVDGMNEAADSKLAAYHRNITEREAFYTQDNVDATQAELPLNPETEAMRTDRMSPSRPDVELTQGEIDVPRRALASMPAERIVAITPAAGAQGLDNKLWRAVQGSLDYTGGLGKTFDDLLQNSVGRAAHSAMHGQRNMYDLDKGFEQMAARMNRERPDVRNEADALKLVKDQTWARMTALEKIPDARRRENALAAYVRDNPELRPLMRFYADITQMSNDLADLLASSKTTPTKADLEFVQKIRDSGFGYMTRIYQAHTGDAGRKIAREFLKQNATAQRRMEQGKSLSEKQTEAVGIYSEAANYLIGKIKIPSIEGMQQMRTPLLNDLFNTWTSHDVDAWRKNVYDEAIAQGMGDKEARAHVKDSMINILDGRRDSISDADLNAKAAASIRELLGVAGRPGAIAQRIGGLRQDRGILQKREEMAPAIERLLGRVTTEPSVVLANTLAKQGELVARTKLLLDLRDSGMVVTKDVAGTAGNERFSHQLAGETSGPLNEMYTTPQVADIINSQMEMYSSATDAMSAAFANSAAAGDTLVSRAADAAAKGAGWAKLSSIVFDGYNLGLNFAGSPFMLAMNGVYNPITAISGLNAGRASVMNVIKDGGAKYNQLLDDGVRYQVVDSARAQELRSSTHEVLKDKIVEGWPYASPAWKKLGKVKQTAVETFSMSDAWVKLAAFQDRVNFLTDFYKAEGVTRTAEEIKTEAGNTVRDTNITYGKTPPLLRMGEKFGVTTFMPYFYNVPRMMARTAIQGYADVMMGVKATNPEAKQLAIKKGVVRLAGLAGSQAAVILGAKAIAETLNDDNEEEVAEMKKMLRDDARFADPIYLGKNKEGMPLFFRTSRVDPMGPVNDVVRVAMDDSIDADEKVAILKKQIGGMLFANRFVASAVGAIIGTDQSKNPMRIERLPVLQDATGAWKNVMGYGNTSRGVLAAADSLLPGWIDAVDPNNPTVADGSEAGAIGELLATLTKVSGGRVDKADPAAVLRGMAFEIKEKKDEARLEVFDRIRRNASPDGTAQAIKSANKDLYDLMSRMTDVYEGMVDGLDYSPSRAMGVLKEAGSLNSIQINNVRRGLPKGDEELIDRVGGVLSKKSIKESGKRLQRGQGDDAQAQYDERSAEVLRVLKDKYGMRAGE